MVHHVFIPDDQTVNQLQQASFKSCLRSCLQVSASSWFLHHDNAPAHTALSVKEFLSKKQITVVYHPSHLPDLVPCEFWFFLRLESFIKGTRFIKGTFQKVTNLSAFRGGNTNKKVY